jgi:proteasome lid subunit RPN8/RPN11
MFNLTQELKNQIKEHSQRELPFESCGLLISCDNEIKFFPCRNSSCFDKKIHFELDSLDYLKASKLGKIISLVHSQENSDTSELDKINSKIHNIKSIIYSWKNDIFFECSGSQLEKYLGKKFNIKTDNCYTLLQDYFKNELGIILKNYSLDENWYEKNPKIIENNFKQNGFIQKDINDIKKNDVILFDLLESGNPHHIGIYLGDNNFLHNQRGGYSNIEYLSKIWKDKIKFVLKHKDIKNE